MDEQWVGTWKINNRVNLFLLDKIDDEALYSTFRSNGAGKPIQQFSHINNVRIWKLRELAEDLAYKFPETDENSKLDRVFVRQMLIETESAVTELLRRGFENEGKIEGFRRGAVVLQCYFIAHESHHRGNIMLTLKESGYKIPKSVEYGIWNWNQI